MTLVKWNPTRELLNAEREFSKLFDNFTNRFGVSRSDGDEEYENAVWMPLTDISESDDHYELNIDLPGIAKEDVKISYSNNELTISGERKQEKESKGSKHHRIERSFGKYYRSFTLPEKIKDDQIDASFKDGQLRIIIPKADEIKPKQIDIKVK